MHRIVPKLARLIARYSPVEYVCGNECEYRDAVQECKYEGDRQPEPGDLLARAGLMGMSHRRALD